MQQLKAAVYFSAGIGDALLLTPLIKLLKKEGYHVTGVFTSAFKVHELYDDLNLLDDKIVILSKPKKVWFVGKYFMNKFHVSIVNYFAASKTNLTVASKTSNKVITNREVVFKTISLKNIQFFQPVFNIHDAEQNINLIKPNHKIHENDFKIDLISKPQIDSSKKIIAIQCGAGNNKTPYKIWNIEHWIELLNCINKDFKGIQFMMLGDKNEISLNKKIKFDNLIQFAGKTNLSELPSVLSKASCFIGSDSGLMHLAVAVDLPTFTIWGASNEQLYSYSSYNSTKHQLVFNEKLNCRPCSAWISANSSRVLQATDCPDFNCLKELDVQFVYKKLHVFLKQHLIND
jgi:ADP-heptose:LPS heptosyltransferase